VVIYIAGKPGAVERTWSGRATAIRSVQMGKREGKQRINQRVQAILSTRIVIQRGRI